MTIQSTKRLGLALGLPLCLAAAGCTTKPQPIEVVISLDQVAQSLSAATILVDYSTASAVPMVANSEVACTSILPHVDAEFSDDGGGGLTIHARSREGFSAPVDLAVCRMVSDTDGITAAAIGANLRVTLLGAVGMDGQRLDERRLAQSRARGRDRAAGADQPPVEVAAAAPPADLRTAPPPRGSTSPRPQQKPGPAEDLRARAPSPNERSPYDSRPTEDERIDQLMREQAEPRTSRRTNAETMRDLENTLAALARGEVPESAAQLPGGDDAAPTSNDETDDDSDAIQHFVTVGVHSDSGTLGSLQFDILGPGGTDGGWGGAGAAAACANHLTTNFNVYNDEGGGRLRAAMIDPAGFEAAGPVTTCVFNSRDRLNEGDFAIHVVDASDRDGNKVLGGSFGMSVFDVRPRS